MAYDLERINPEINIMCQKLNIKRLDLFGSITSETLGPESDIDVLVEFDRKPGHLFDRYFELKEGLETLLGRPVDVVVMEPIKNPYFKIALESSRKNIYYAD